MAIARRDQRRPRGGRHRRPAGTCRSTRRWGSRSTRSAVRVDRLTEAVAVLKGCFADGAVQLRGRALHDHGPRRRCRSRSSSPSRRCSSAVAAGGCSRWPGARPTSWAWRRGRSRARGREVVRSDPRSITIAATEEKLGWVREAAGDRFDDLEINTYPSGTSPISHRPRAARTAPTCSTGSAPGPGSRSRERRVARVAAHLHRLGRRARREVPEQRERLGISSIMVGDIDTLAPVVERLAGT